MYSAEHWTTGWQAIDRSGRVVCKCGHTYRKELQCAEEEMSLLGQDMIITTYGTYLPRYLTIHSISPS